MKDFLNWLGELLGGPKRDPKPVPVPVRGPRHDTGRSDLRRR